MKPTIDLWSYKHPVPEFLAQGASSIPLMKLRDDCGVRMAIFNGVECMITDGYVPMHKDWDEISLMMVIRNDVDSWVCSKGVSQVKKQPPGTMILLDIGHEHGLNVKRGFNGESGIWVAAIIESFDSWPSKRKVNKSMREFVERFCETPT